MSGAILLVANYESDVGYAWWLMENFWAEIAGMATRQGRRCILAYPRVNSIPATVASAPISIVEQRIDFASRKDRTSLKTLVREHGITAVYLTDYPLLSPWYAWLRAIGVRRIVVHCHTPGDRPPVRGLARIAKRTLHAARILSATRYLGVSEFVRDRMVENGCVSAALCIAVPNGIPPAPTDPRDRAALRRELDVPEGVALGMMLSRATRYKGLDALVEIASVIRQRGRRDIMLLHCGDGPDLDAAAAEAQARGLDGVIRFVGRRPDARALLRAADFAVHPSRGEAHCLAILEYLDAGLPVIVPDRPSVAQDIEPEVTGLHYPAEHASMAVDAILRLADDPAARARMGTAGRALVAQRFTIEATNARLLSALEGEL